MPGPPKTSVMFSENPGPTALRRDLVLAMSFANAEVVVEGADGPERSIAALSGVWNGTKGYLAVLIRAVESASVRRFTYAHPLQTPDEVWGALDEAVAFLEGMGFQMDPAEFTTLAEDAQVARLQAWDALRKGGRRSPQAAPRAEVDPSTQTGSAVLGRVAVLRGAELARARLLAQY